MSIKAFHVPLDQLFDLVERRVHPDEQARVSRHITECSRCGSDAAWFKHTISVMRTDQGEDAPYYAVERAVLQFRVRAREEAPGLRQRVVAALRFDSAQLPLAFGVRAVETPPRQLVFGLGNHSLDLRLEPVGGMWKVVGQVFGPGCGAMVELEGPAGTVQEEMNGVCEFVLPPVPPGTYTLRLQGSELDAEVPDLDVGL